jgi:hypothetical protein
MPRRRPQALAAVTLLACATALAACGNSGGSGPGPIIGQKGNSEKAASQLGFPAFATKNTTRVGGSDPTADAAAVAQAVFPSQSSSTRPAAVALVDRKDWQGGVAGAVFMAPTTRAPTLLTDGGDLPKSSSQALGALDPGGIKKLDNAQVIRIGDVAKPGGRHSVQASGKNPYALAAAIDLLATKAAGRPSDRVVIASGEQSAYAMPAAGWAAKSGDPILYVRRDTIPNETLAALKRHQQPKIYVLGPPSAISDKTLGQLRKLGTTTRIQGKDAVANAIAFARFVDGRFGWGVDNPGHGLVFVSPARPLDAAAAAPLSASGTYGPLLLLGDKGKLSNELISFLLDIQPGYDTDPVRGVYNHGWLIGDQKVISLGDQSRIDSLLEIAPASGSPAGTLPST